eukprot:5731052-Prymnesium_polylepis.1
MVVAVEVRPPSMGADPGENRRGYGGRPQFRVISSGEERDLAQKASSQPLEIFLASCQKRCRWLALEEPPP